MVTFLKNLKKIINYKMTLRNNKTNQIESKDVGLKSEIFSEISYLQQKILDDITKVQFSRVFDLTKKQKRDFIHKCNLLKKGYPLDYLLSKTIIAGHHFFIPKGVFIPREETEEISPKLVTWVLEIKNKFKNDFKNRFQLTSSGYKLDFIEEINLVENLVDMCCGSGFLSILLAKNFNKVYNVDISDLALKTTIKNAKQNSILNLTSIRSDAFGNPNISNLLQQKPWILVCNPPYVPLSDKKFAAQQKIQFEPKIAIYSGKDGLNFFSRILKQLAKMQNKPLGIFFELDERNVFNAQAKMNLFLPKYQTQIWQDCNQKNRFLVATLTT